MARDIDVWICHSMEPRGSYELDYKMDKKSVMKKREKIVELIEIDGKKVSITSTGKRKFHNKSKNGCDNCKRRRVKCDEGKPSCRKCINMKLNCVYTPSQPKKRRESTVVKYVTRRAPNGNEVVTSEVGTGTGTGPSSDESSCNSSRSVSRVVPVAAEEITQADLQERRVFGGMPVKSSSAQHIVQSQQTSQHLLQRQNTQSNRSAISSTPASRSLPDGVLLPLGSESTHLSQQQQLQQQLLLLPQLMTLSNSEKYAAFEMPNSPSLQSNAMNTTNSIGSIFPPSRFQEQQLQQVSAQPPNLPSFQAESIAQLSKASANRKAMGTFPTAGIGGITYDFQELLGIKYASNFQASKASNAEEALANMQEQQEQATKTDSNNRGRNSSHANENNSVQMLSTPNNPTISPAASISPMAKSSINAADAGSSSVTTASGTTVTSLPRNGRMDQSRPQGQASPNNNSGSGYVANLLQLSRDGNLNLIDLKLFHHYCTKVWPSITAAGISGPEVWNTEIPELAFDYPFLMHALLAFSATHLSRTESRMELGLEPYVSSHRLDALRLLRQAVLQISEDNTDALVASALILIMDSLANASNQNSANPNSMSPSAWIFHVKGAATILTAVWPLTEKSRFYNLISVDLSDLGDVINQDSATVSELVCFDESIADLYPVEIDSPYLITLAYLDKLQREKNQSDFILRVFAFPALLDKTFLALLMTGDPGAMRIMRSYYKLLRGFTTEMKDKIWFLEGVSQVLPQDVDEYSGGGGMHMMLDFLGGGLPSMTTTNLSDFM